MRTVLTLVAGVLLVLGAFWFFFTRGPAIRNLEGPGTTIVAFGDSLIEGRGATAGNDLVSVLSRRINRPIVNLGKSGDTTVQALSRLPDVLAQKPRIVIVLFGGNDYLRAVPEEETFKNLAQIIRTVQAEGSAVLLLGVRGGIMNDLFAEDFAALAATYETGFVPDVLDGLLGRSAYMADAVHPNDAGYARIADRVVPVLEKMVKR